VCTLQSFIVSCSCSDYLRKAESRLQEEATRNEHYLDVRPHPTDARQRVFQTHRTWFDHCESARGILSPQARTGPKIRRKVQDTMVLAHMETLVDMESTGLVSMLRDDKVEDLGRMYTLFREVQGGTELILQVSHLRPPPL
jgi:cullin 3